MANEQGVLIFGEAVEGRLAGITIELLGAARRLADQLGQAVNAAFLGKGIKDIASNAFAYGADSVYVVDDDILADYLNETYTAAAQRVCERVNPKIILMGQTNTGRDLAPRLAFRLGTAVAMDCIDLSLKGGRLLATRPCYGGSALAVFAFRSVPQMATVRAKSQEPLEPDPSRAGQVEQIDSGLDAGSVRMRLVERTRQKADGIRLEDAPVVVSGGRGLGGPEAFKSLEELADILSGAVGASRAACDLGWYPVSHQVGLTGKVVTPDLYLAVAISGASQHMAGITQVKNIAAINKDSEASIFKAARFGVIDDWKEVLPAFLEKCRELRTG